MGGYISYWIQIWLRVYRLQAGFGIAVGETERSAHDFDLKYTDNNSFDRI
jgi:hypothetical protein